MELSHRGEGSKSSVKRNLQPSWHWSLQYFDVNKNKCAPPGEDEIRHKTSRGGSKPSKKRVSTSVCQSVQEPLELNHIVFDP